jgi:molecular chaperone GrpE
MEEKSGQKPLRTSSNTERDIKDTYLKNDGKKNVHTFESNKHEAKEVEGFEEMSENIQDVNEEIAAEETEGTELNALKEQIAQLESEKEELKNQVVRKAAEFENLRKRTMREKQELLEFGSEKLLFKMLELLDDINNAVDASQTTKDFDSLLKGLQMIKSKADKLFSESGVKLMEIKQGDEFDVDFHEAMMHISSNDVEEGHIVQVIQKGYMLSDKVLRHAKVITSAGSDKK